MLFKGVSPLAQAGHGLCDPVKLVSTRPRDKVQCETYSSAASAIAIRVHLTYNQAFITLREQNKATHGPPHWSRGPSCAHTLEIGSKAVHRSCYSLAPTQLN